MGKHKSEEKKKKKNSQLIIRVEKVERDAFVALCEKLDTSAAREIRRFMRDWVNHNAVPLLVEEQTQDKAPVEVTLPLAIETAAADAISSPEKPKAKRKATAD